jgi:hypothetical protein
MFLTNVSCSRMRALVCCSVKVANWAGWFLLSQMRIGEGSTGVGFDTSVCNADRRLGPVGFQVRRSRANCGRHQPKTEVQNLASRTPRLSAPIPAPHNPHNSYGSFHFDSWAELSVSAHAVDSTYRGGLSSIPSSRFGALAHHHISVA